MSAPTPGALTSGTAGGRALVTGIGVVAPNGTGVPAYWSATLAGKSGIRPLPSVGADYPLRVGGVAEDFVAGAHLPPRLTAQTDRWTAFGLAAATEAFADAGIDPTTLPEYEFGVVTGSSSGGNEFGQREIARLWSQGPQFVGAYQSIAWFYAATTGQLSIRYGARGPCGVLVSEQAAGLDALADARRLLRAGSRLVVSGGAEAPLSPYAIVCQLASGRLATGDDPHRSYLPFAADAAGYVPGEGGAILLVEREDSARSRGARGYAEIAGCAATFDPRPGTGEPGLRRAIEAALADAGQRPADVDVVFADGAGVREADRQEAAAIAAVFGPGRVPVAVPKTMTGRMYAGGAALDVVAAVLAIRDSVLPPAVGIGAPAPDCPLDLVLEVPRPARVRVAVVLARGYGGFNAALVVRAV
ncbi:ketosynthase chain-length factor [Solwaraspora sp. WMMA2056]|uniref:ketosynthase chain-length factor n=1 Tax=Solwaraspora sp. WMMA2056 TaxID=3015161 RepID=UPI00259B636E|nr:ketosynthase chain-length factor [Solwaraspora sp. WMMA2056]WJK38228.1 ketosynthase chain-length factor [Solwaraspora sp. WMMA2056]